MWERRFFRKTFAFAVLAGVIVVGLLVVIQVIFFLPYRSFHAHELETILLFDRLNDAILSEIGIPEGVVEVKVSRVGIDSSLYQHGRELKVSYSPTSSNVTLADISLYYSKALWDKGWTQLSQVDVGISYYRDTACVHLNFGLSNNEYRLTIWHDFTNQDFSPSFPSSWVMAVNEFYPQRILRCPP